MKDFVQARIESPAFDADSVRIAELSGRETISRLFEFQMRLVTLQGELDEEALLTSQVTIVFERKASDTGEVTVLRRIPGMICSLRDRMMSESVHREYVVTFVPRAWQATLTSTSDVCMEMSVPDIAEMKLKEGAGFASSDYELRLTNKYPKREFVVQYKESSFDFVCRLVEHLGIHFCFEEIDGKEVMVFGDENSAFTPASPDRAAFNPRGDRTDVYELETRRQLVPKTFVARDYNYRNPSMDLLGEAQTEALGSGKIDEFGPHVKTPEEATRHAKLRAQEATSQHLTFEGRSDLPGLRAGSLLIIEGHPRGELAVVVTEVVHEIGQAVLGVAAAADRPYQNTFRALPKGITYRPPRVTPIPIVHGVVTGLVQSESSTKVGAIDDQGRYKVAFMYDSVTGRGDGKASRSLRMAQPSAGAERGFHAPLKPGTEVIITCLNGDPDRPIIAGAVPNPQTPSPVSSANAEKSMWTTNVNSIAIDDDQPRCKVSVSGEDHVFQVGEPNAPEQGIVSATIGNVSTMANGAATQVSDSLTTWQDWKTAATAQDIVNIAGVPSPWSLWKKIEAVAGALVGFAKTAMAIPAGVQQIATDDAKEEKKEADAALEAAKTQAATDLGLDVTPRQVPGTMRMETAAEARDRALSEAQASGDPAATAALAPVATAQAASDAAAAEVKSFEDWTEENLKTPDEVIKSAEAALGVVKSGAKLISQLGKIFAKVTEKAEFLALKSVQKAAGKVPPLSGQRNAANVGNFDKSFNIQGATDSIGIQGMKNAIVFGGLHATLFSPKRAAVISVRGVDIKAGKVVEIASKEVMASAKVLVDVHSCGKLKLVAHTGDKEIAIPGGHTMFFHSKEGIMMDSCDKDIEAKAKKNIRMTAETENIELKAKQGFKLETSDKDINVNAAKGKIVIQSNDGASSYIAKKKLVLQSMEDNFTLVADKGKGTVKASKELNFEAKSGGWKSSGAFELKASKVVVKASKIEIG